MAPRTQPRRASTPSQPARFNRSPGRAQTGRRAQPGRRAPAGPRVARNAQSRRFGRTTAQPTRRTVNLRRQPRQPEPSGLQGLLKRFGGALPLGRSAGKGAQRSGGSLPVVGGLLKSLGGNERSSGSRGGKPALFGLLGAGAAGAGAAVFAKRRKDSSSSEDPSSSEAASISETSEPKPSTPATQPPQPDGPAAGTQPG